MKIFSFTINILALILILFACNSPDSKQNDATKVNQGDLESNLQLKLLPVSVSGINFKNNLPEPTEEWCCFAYFNIYNGGGVAIGDINNDQLPDLYFTGNAVPNKLFLNKGGLSFEDITENAGVAGNNSWTTGTVMADVNSDGLLDIYVCITGSRFDQPDERKNLLFINNGDETFTESATKHGIDDNGFSNHAVFLDYDNDGDLDLYVVNHPKFFGPLIHERLELEKNPKIEESDKLFENNGQGIFKDVTKQANLLYYGFGLSVNTADFNNDGFLDIYVANDYSELDKYWLNNGDGTFTDVVKTSFPHVSQFSMGGDAADFNNDGWIDLLTVDMMAETNRRKKTNMSAMNPTAFAMNVEVGRHYQYMQNVLQVNNGNNTFSDVAEMGGLAYTDWSWSALFGDVNNDGNKDIFISNGERRDVRNNDFSKNIAAKNSTDHLIQHAKEYVAMIPEEPLENYLFINNGDLQFDKKGASFMSSYKGYTNGAGLADLDNDGDLDLVVNNIDDVSMIFENTMQGNYLKVGLTGNNKNKFSLGARVVISVDNKKQLFELTSTRGFLSSPEPIAHFGLGKNETIDELTVTWLGGKTIKMNNVPANQLLTLHESDAVQSSAPKPNSKKLISKVSTKAQLNFKHKEIEYDDYKKEILLPHKYSQQGPYISTGDINGDGFEDLFVGGAHGQAAQLFMQNQNGTFQLKSQQTWTNDKHYEDIGSVFFDADGDSDLDLYVVSGSNEWEAGSENYTDRLYINNGRGDFKRTMDAIPSITESGSCVKAGDVDGDGDLDLFVGGRVVPGKYPYSPNSFLLINEGGKFSDATSSITKDSDFGMITDAEWCDYDGDSDLDLVIVGEWMTPRFFTNEQGKLKEVTGSLQLGSYFGWWYSLTADDFDNDGDIDFIAGNLGLNSKYTTKDGPIEVYSDDFDGNGSNDIVLTYYNQGGCYPVRGRQCSSQQIPDIEKKFQTYDAFGSAPVESVYGQGALQSSLHHKANWMNSSYIENKGNGTFKVIALPAAAQVSTVNGIVVDDVNGDGIKDLIIGGNMYHAEVETCRHDASIGLVLLGDGKGGFKPLSYSESGFYAPGDIKDLKAINRADGSKLLLVTENNNDLKIYSYSGSLIQ